MEKSLIIVHKMLKIWYPKSVEEAGEVYENSSFTEFMIRHRTSDHLKGSKAFIRIYNVRRTV